MKEIYDNGDKCWIFAGEKDAKGNQKLSPATVVHTFYTPWRALRQYVVLLDDPDFEIMEVRDAQVMTDDPDNWPAYSMIRRALPPNTTLVRLPKNTDGDTVQ